MTLGIDFPLDALADRLSRLFSRFRAALQYVTAVAAAKADRTEDRGRMTNDRMPDGA